MKTIWKIQLRQKTGISEVQLPEGTLVLSIHNQYDTLIMYAEVETTAPLKQRTFMIVETGKEIPSAIYRKYIGSELFHNGTYVLHVYEIKGE